MKGLCLLLFSSLLSVASLGAMTEYEKERQEARRLLSEDFVALNEGRLSLQQMGDKVFTLAQKEREGLRRRIFLEGAKRFFERAGNKERVKEVDVYINLSLPSGKAVTLPIGIYGEVEFAHCPTGSVDLSVHWRNGKTVNVTLTRPYWIMKYPLTVCQAALYPPLDAPKHRTNHNYTCPNRHLAEEICKCFTKYFKDVLPEGYEIRLPTLAEWEHAYHAGTRDKKSLFFDLLHIHKNDEVEHKVRYDYDRKKEQRKQAVNDWGIGDWCDHEKVYDMVDPSKIEVSPKDKGPHIQVRALPPLETTVDPCFTYEGSDAMTLIRMPFWARWKAARIGFDQDWCPIRLVIAPKIK
jgi:hypothetical protein